MWKGAVPWPAAGRVFRHSGTWGQAGDRLNAFVISRFFFIHFSITGAKNTVRYIEVFV